MAKLKTLPAPHDEVEDRLVMLFAAWKAYDQLFKAEANVDLLNRQIPAMGWLLQMVLSDTVLLSICRLCEHGKPVTLPALLKSLKVLAKPDEFRDLTERLATITAAVEPMKRHRDSRIAHNAQRRAAKTENSLAPVTSKHIQETLDNIVSLMNRISDLFLDHETVYVPELLGDGDGLIQCLRLAERLHELQDDAWGGKMTEQEVIEKLRNRGNY